MKTTSKSRVPAERQTIRILSAGAKGGPGKSFIVKNLAAKAASEGLKTAIVDFDPQRSISNWLDRREATKPDLPKIDVFELSAVSQADARKVLEHTDHDYIFIDTPPSIDHEYGVVLKQLALGVDLVVLPTKCGVTDRESLETLLFELQSWGVPSMVVINQAARRSRRVADMRARMAGISDLCPVEIYQLDDHMSADEYGLGSTEVDGFKGAEDIANVWFQVQLRVNRQPQSAAKTKRLPATGPMHGARP